jgi:hypothetical protein
MFEKDSGHRRVPHAEALPLQEQEPQTFENDEETVAQDEETVAHDEPLAHGAACAVVAEYVQPHPARSHHLARGCARARAQGCGGGGMRAPEAPPARKF